MSDPPAIEGEQLTIAARDGYQLGATYFAAADSGAAPQGVISFHSATATPQTFYYHCARFFAARGYHVYTYDYRGIGRSAPKTLKGFEATVESLALHDIPAVLDFISNKHPGLPQTYVGHSVGGQLMGMLDNASLIHKAVTCSSQNGYWKLQGGSQKYVVLFSMYVAFPLLTRLCGYFPWSRMAGGEDLPKGAALQWARWCRSPNYLFDDAGLPHLARYDDFTAPILAYCFSDDDWGTRAAVHSLMDHYTAADLQYRYVDPADFGRSTIGHFGYFKRGSDSLWDNTLQWIRGGTEPLE